MPYDFTLYYQPGNGNPVDYLSRSNPPAKIVDKHSTNIEDHVNLIISNSVPVSIALQDLKKVAAADPAICNLIMYLGIYSFLQLASSQSTRYRVAASILIKKLCCLITVF